MDRLSSCYFCGGALDASVKAYPVVPKELQSSDGGRTVVLCRGCREKLATIIEEVVAATESDASADGDTSGEQRLEETGFEPIASDDGTESDPLGDEQDGDTDEDGGLLGGGSQTATDDGAASTDDGTATADDSPTATEANGTAADDSDDGPSLTRLEYNKVMRLLQNREFPVDRAEIREVATSAYQISPEEFDAVIEAAIERDLIAERKGQFVDP